MTTKVVSLDDIENALRNLGGRARAISIKQEIFKRFGGLPSNYASVDTFNNTIQRIIENYCPESDNYRSGKRQVFRRFAYGYYELIESPTLLEDVDQINNTTANATTKKQLVDARLGQGAFRQGLLA